MGFIDGLLDTLTFGLTDQIGYAFNQLFGGSSAEKVSDKQAARNFEYSKALAKYQYDLQKQQFDYTNKYNTPSNQVQRIIDAGLNPNLMYGSGSVANTGSMPSVSQPHMNQTDPMSLANYQLQMASAYKNMQLQQANIHKVEEDAKGVNLENRLKEYQLKKAAAEEPYYVENAEQLAKAIRFDARVKEYKSNTAAYESELKEMENIALRYMVYLDGEEKPDNMSWDEWFRMERIADSPLGKALRNEYELRGVEKARLEEATKILIEQLRHLKRKYTSVDAQAEIDVIRKKFAQLGINFDNPDWYTAVASLLGLDNITSAVSSFRSFASGIHHKIVTPVKSLVKERLKKKK